jgi:hypothetical protein
MKISRSAARPSSARAHVPSALPLADTPVIDLMRRLQADPTDPERLLLELQRRYSWRLDLELRRNGVRCHTRRDEHVQRVWAILWERCLRSGSWDPAQARNAEDPLWGLLKTISKNSYFDDGRRRKTELKRLNALQSRVEASGIDVETTAWTETRQVEGPLPREPREKPLAALTRRKRVLVERHALTEFANLPKLQRVKLLLAARGLTTREVGLKLKRSPGQVAKGQGAAREQLLARALEAVDGHSRAVAHASGTRADFPNGWQHQRSPGSRVLPANRAIGSVEADDGGQVAV